MGAVGVLAVGEKSLVELATEINHGHEATQKAALMTVQRAVEVGEALIQVRGRVKANGWRKWVEGNLTFSYSVAATYIRLARFKEIVLAEGVTSIGQAQKLLADLPPAHPIGGRPTVIPDEIRSAMVQLREDGMSYRAIADALGVSDSTVRKEMDREGYNRRMRENAQRRTRERQEVRLAAERRAAKRASKPLADAYAMAEKMQDVLGQAHAEAPDSEARRALAVAGEHYRKMRDEIVRALGVS